VHAATLNTDVQVLLVDTKETTDKVDEDHVGTRQTSITEQLVCVEVHADVPVDFFFDDELFRSDSKNTMQTYTLFA
jgi:hypothetical protein